MDDSSVCLQLLFWTIWHPHLDVTNRAHICWYIQIESLFLPLLRYTHSILLMHMAPVSTQGHQSSPRRLLGCLILNLPLHLIDTYNNSISFSSVQFSCSVVSDSLRPHESARQASLSITNSQSSLRLTSIESVMPSSHLMLCRPLLLLPPIPPSIRVFSNESTLRMRWPKYWSFSLVVVNLCPSSPLPSFKPSEFLTCILATTS